MPHFSTDPIALSVNCFIARRVALMSQPDTDAEDSVRHSPAPIEVLYLSLYAKRNSHLERWHENIRAAATMCARLTLGGRANPTAPADKALPASP